MVESYPLEWPAGWPRTAAHKRSKSRFGKNLGFSQIIELKEELRRLGARDVVVSSNVPIRNDGLPYANEMKRKIDDPGVAVFFVLNGKPLSMARDSYLTPYENVRSLVKAIDALRGIERHGGATMMERAFSGFTALAAPEVKRDWWDVLQVRRDSTKETIMFNYRALARDRHPDAGGSDQQMAELNAARDEAFRHIGIR